VIIEVIEQMNIRLMFSSVLLAIRYPRYAKSVNPKITGRTPMKPMASVRAAKAESL
jgi:hypothetical protein